MTDYTTPRRDVPVLGQAFHDAGLIIIKPHTRDTRTASGTGPALTHSCFAAVGADTERLTR